MKFIIIILETLEKFYLYYTYIRQFSVISLKSFSYKLKKIFLSILLIGVTELSIKVVFEIPSNFVRIKSLSK